VRSYRYIAALVLLLGVAGVGFGRAGIDSAGASSVRLTAGQIVYGHSLDSHHHVQNTATSFSTSDHFSWRAKFMHTAVAHNISRMTLTAAGKLISVRRPFSGNATYDYAWGDFSMSEFMANNGVSGSGTYVMRYVDKKGGTLAVGVFTIR
jgi:hypothetical protein